MNCPKCGFQRQPESNECPKCGILYDKYEDFIKNKRTEHVRIVITEEVEEKIKIKEIVKLFLEKLSIKERIESFIEFVKVFLQKLSIKKIPQPTSFQKKALILLAVLIITGIGFMIFKPDITINGEIFIVKKEGQNIKLEQVEVKAFPTDTLLPYLLKRKKDRDNQHSILVKKIEAAKIEYDAAFQEVENAFNWDFDNFDKAIEAREKSDLKLLKLRTEEKEITSCNFFFQELPVPLTSTITNSEGKFNLLIPGSGSHVIAASVTHQVFDDIEKYYWITTIDPKHGSRQTAILSNGNLASTDDIEVLIAMYAQESP